MKCPECKTNTRIVDSRAHEQGTWRRHRCSCGVMFTTMELVCATLPSKKGRPFGAKAIGPEPRAKAVKGPPIGTILPDAPGAVARPLVVMGTTTRERLARLREARELATMDDY